jgi:hypothetical protein
MRREWNNHYDWASDLRLLPRLAVLLVKTKVSLVDRPGDRVQEARLVTRWAGGSSEVDHAKFTSALQRHPALHHLAFWYLSTNDLGFLSLWDNRGGTWIQTMELEGRGKPIELAMFS